MSISAAFSNFLGVAGFSTSVMRSKTIVQLESQGVMETLPNGVQGPRSGKFWLLYILSSLKHCSRGSAKTNGDKTLQRIRGSAFGIPKRYTGLKIAHSKCSHPHRLRRHSTNWYAPFLLE